MHSLTSAFVLAYHGCSRRAAEKLVNGEEFAESQNRWDWLGSGIYFWEANPLRAREWAAQRFTDAADQPGVVGVALDLGLCLDLMSMNGQAVVRESYLQLSAVAKEFGEVLPRNTGGQDSLRRELDCLVINNLHESRKEEGRQPFDSVRGLFVEGDELFPGSGFRDRTHVQICTRNRLKIHGVFHVPERYFSH